MHKPIPSLNKPPSKSECLRMLRAAFGPRTRFASFGDGLAVVAYTDEGHEFHVAEIEPKVNGQGQRGRDDLLPWYATIAAFHAQGFRLEKGPHGWEVVPLAERPAPKRGPFAAVSAFFAAWLAKLFPSKPAA